jgi:hypothetical protein
MNRPEAEADQVLVIRDHDSTLKELAGSLQSDEDVDPAMVEYEPLETPGQLGEPVTIAIAIFGGAVIAGAGNEIGRRSASAIWNKVSKWHKRHNATANFAARDAAGEERRIEWDEVERRLRPPGGTS